MTALRNSQHRFVLDLAQLINHINSLGLGIQCGEVWRTMEQQKLNVKKGVSKTLDSYHLDRLAIDLLYSNYDGSAVSYDTKKKIGLYWELLTKGNKAGVLWGWDDFHFQGVRP